MYWFSPHIVSVLVFLISLVFVSFLLRAKKAPGNTWAWLLFIFLIPYLGIPFYLLFSSRKFRMNKASIKEDAKCRISFNREVAVLSSSELAFSSLLSLLDSAQESIHLSTFLFSADSIGTKVLERLTTKAKAGVRVKILIDSLGSCLVKRPNFHEYLQAGGMLAYSMPVLSPVSFWRSNLRSHRKMLIVDSARAMMGGMNISESYFSARCNNLCWLDLALYLDGGAAFDLQELFASDWSLATKEVISFQKILQVPGRHRVQILASGPENIGDKIYDYILTSIFKAKHSIWIATPYFIPDESLAKALELAAKRGIDVKILLPKKSNHLLADIARGSYLRQLVAQGCHVYFFPKMLHAKAFFLDDDSAIIGSANFDMRSLLYNFEVGACLLSKEDIEATRNWFLSNFSHCSELLTPANFWTENLEGVGRVLGTLI